MLQLRKLAEGLAVILDLEHKEFDFFILGWVNDVVARALDLDIHGDQIFQAVKLFYLLRQQNEVLVIFILL